MRTSSALYARLIAVLALAAAFAFPAQADEGGISFSVIKAGLVVPPAPGGMDGRVEEQAFGGMAEMQDPAYGCYKDKNDDYAEGGGHSCVDTG